MPKIKTFNYATKEKFSKTNLFTVDDGKWEFDLRYSQIIDDNWSKIKFNKKIILNKVQLKKFVKVFKDLYKKRPNKKENIVYKMDWQNILDAKMQGYFDYKEGLFVINFAIKNKYKTYFKDGVGIDPMWDDRITLETYWTGYGDDPTIRISIFPKDLEQYISDLENEIKNN